MSDQMNDVRVREVIEQEGLDYAVRHYMRSDHIQNPVTAALWKSAADALDALAEHLGLDD